MARTWADLRAQSKDRLIAEYDRTALTTTAEGLTFLREVIFQRDLEEAGARMEGMTRMIQTLTWVITALTVINTAAVIVALLVGH